MENNTLNKKSFFKRIFSDYSYCWLAAFCTAGLMLLVFFCFNLFPFGDKTILRMDLYHQYGPLFAEFYDRVTNLESLIYSWRSGLGAPFLGNFFNYLSSPTSLIILLLGHENMPESIAAMIFIKALASSFTFTYYLKKSKGEGNFSTAAFGVLYSMCGYFVAYYWNVMWIDAMALFPLVILGIEKIVNRKSPALYIATLSLTLLSNYYMGYMTCIMSVVYFVYYFSSEKSISALEENTPYYYNGNLSKKYKIYDRITGNVFLRRCVTFGFSSLAAGCIVAVSLIPTMLILRSCSATGADMPDKYVSYFSIFDFLANHLGSVVPTIRSSGDDVLPNVYCGIATLILVPLYLFSRRIPLKEKIATVALLAFFYASFNINYLNFIWHGFHFPNDLPYRFSFMYSFILLKTAYRAFSCLEEFTGKEILRTGCCLVFAVVLVQKITSKNVEDITVILSIIFIVTYTIILFLMRNEKSRNGGIAILLLCAVIGELACCTTDRFEMNQYKSIYCSDYRDFRNVKSELNKIEGSDKYRMELTYNRARMDPCWFGYNGISTFSSMAYEKMSNVQSDLGVYGNYINSYTYYLQTPVYNMMHSLKYLADNDKDVHVSADYFDKLFESDNFTVYENKYWLPIAMAVNNDLKMWATDYSNPFLVQNDWMEYSTGVGDVFEMMEISDIRYYNVDPIESGLSTGDLYFNKTPGKDGEITFYISTDEFRHCYLFVDSGAFKNIEITRNGESVTQYTDEPYIYDLGVLGPDDETSVLVKPEEKDYGYIDFFPFYVNEDKLEEGYKILKEHSLNVTKFEDTRIEGTIKAEDDMMVFTSIPYDKGWTVTVDGEKIKADDYISLCEAYLCFKIGKGGHTVTLTYSQPGLLLGAAISVTALLLTIAVFVIFKRKKSLWEQKKAGIIAFQEERKVVLQSQAIDQPENGGCDFAPFDGTNETIASETVTEAEEINMEFLKPDVDETITPDIPFDGLSAESDVSITVEDEEKVQNIEESAQNRADSDPEAEL
ncbi:MAG: YfhO family protein [Clostridiales bacterium]|nr:YfhO family protein [Clostridiales bacterium]